VVAHLTEQAHEAITEARNEAVSPRSPVWDHLDGAVIPKLQHARIFLVCDRQSVTEDIPAPVINGCATFFRIRLSRVNAGREDPDIFAAGQPSAHALNHPSDGLADMLRALPPMIDRQSAVEIDANPALLMCSVSIRIHDVFWVLN